MGWFERLFYTSPDPGQCDGGFFIECCTDLAGRTVCGPTFRALAVPPLAVVGQVQQWIQEWRQQDLTLGEAYSLAKIRGYEGSEQDFAKLWNPDAGSTETTQGNTPALVGPTDVPGLAKQKYFDLELGDTSAYIGVGLAGLAGGLAVAYWKGRRLK